MTHPTTRFDHEGWPPPGRPGLWSRLSTVQRLTLIGAATLLTCCGGVAAIGAKDGGTKQASRQVAATTTSGPAAGTGTAASAVVAAETTTDTAATDTAATDTAATEAAATRTPVVTKKTVTERKNIAHTTRTVKDGTLAEGTTKVRTAGSDGVKTLTYQVTLTDGRETGRTLISETVTKKPVTRVVVVGTRANDCDPNYTPCVPIASDVDCAGGSGNGPAYVEGPVTVIGEDIYDLDRDGDGIGCN